MPLYDYLCSAGHRFEALVALADFAASARLRCDCGHVATRQISQVAFHGATTTARGIGTGAWDNRGMWGGTAGSDSSAVTEMRKRLEAGQIPRGKDRTMALSYVREAQIAAEAGMTAEVQMYERGLRGIASKVDRARAGELPTVRIGRRKYRKIVKRGFEPRSTADARTDGPGRDVVQRISFVDA
ncbi:MAG: zinc ribbon domain-containing protein [Verrucomicrobiota bacterium]